MVARRLDGREGRAARIGGPDGSAGAGPGLKTMSAMMIAKLRSSSREARKTLPISARAADEEGPSDANNAATLPARGPRYSAPTRADTTHRPMDTATHSCPKLHCCATMITPAANRTIDAGRKTRMPMNAAWRPKYGSSNGSELRWARIARTCMATAPPTQMTAQMMWM